MFFDTNALKSKAQIVKQNEETDFPIFIVGSSRSGTTLLYSIIIASEAFPVYEAETMLLTVGPYKYGKIDHNVNYNRFLNDWFRSKQFTRSGLAESLFVSLANQYRQNYTQFLKFFMTQIAASQNKRRWVEKTPGHLYHVEYLARAFPTARFIVLVRDGRDVALSKRKLGWTGTKSSDPLKQLMFGAINWELDIAKGKDVCKQLGSRCIQIHYEDLILKAEATIKLLEKFIGADIDLAKVRRSSLGSLKKVNSAFEPDFEPFSRSAINRWKKALNAKESLAIHSIIGKTLAECGYELPGHLKMGCNIHTIKFGLKKQIYKNEMVTKNYLRRHTFLGRVRAPQFEMLSN